MEKFLSKIPVLLAHDKCLHLIGGLILFTLLVRVMPPIYAQAVVTEVGLLKEWYDLRHKATHTADLLDAAATSLGGGVGWSVILLNSYR